jgi:hypothetical protein
MDELYRGTVRTHYSQLGLIDSEDPDTYPQWTDVAPGVWAFFGPKGVVVGVGEDACVDVGVYRGPEAPGDMVLLLSGEIEVGSDGLVVGTVDPAEKVEWPPGPVHVRTYVDSLNRKEITRVAFVLDRPSGRLVPRPVRGLTKRRVPEITGPGQQCGHVVVGNASRLIHVDAFNGGSRSSTVTLSVFDRGQLARLEHEF